MNDFAVPLAFTGLALLAGLVQFAWQVAVIVFMYKIWQKVKHLSG